GAMLTINGNVSGGGLAVNSTAAGASVDWTGGFLSGTFDNTGPFDLSGSAAKYLVGTINESGGAGTWTGTGGLLLVPPSPNTAPLPPPHPAPHSTPSPAPASPTRIVGPPRSTTPAR